ncbi:MAG: anti-anti-sigma factor [Legionellales bacterium]|nr:anti-anti-sigma factor [Legionellales bacterium]|tara:strand:- start:3515 stop:3829 length:315 start_codon:yes stop_codon:yes gene_type:complete
MTNQVELKTVAPGQLKLIGTLSFATVPGIHRAGCDKLAEHAQVTIDLSDVNYSDSSGLALLAEWVRFASSKNKTLVYHNMPEQMRAIAKVTGIERVLPINDACS